jgi:hypothetical protein
MTRSVEERRRLFLWMIVGGSIIFDAVALFVFWYLAPFPSLIGTAGTAVLSAGFILMNAGTSAYVFRTQVTPALSG